MEVANSFAESIFLQIVKPMEEESGGTTSKRCVRPHNNLLSIKILRLNSDRKENVIVRNTKK